MCRLHRHFSRKSRMADFITKHPVHSTLEFFFRFVVRHQFTCLPSIILKQFISYGNGGNARGNSSWLNSGKTGGMETLMAPGHRKVTDAPHGKSRETPRETLQGTSFAPKRNLRMRRAALTLDQRALLMSSELKCTKLYVTYLRYSAWKGLDKLLSL